MQDTMKVLVTGGAGYLGSIMVPYLLSHGCDVLVLDNFIYGQSSLLDCCIDERLTVVRGDARDTQLVTRLIKDRDVIIALAAIVGATACDRDQVAARSINFEDADGLGRQTAASLVSSDEQRLRGWGMSQ